MKHHLPKHSVLVHSLTKHNRVESVRNKMTKNCSTSERQCNSINRVQSSVNHRHVIVTCGPKQIRRHTGCPDRMKQRCHVSLSLVLFTSRYFCVTAPYAWSDQSREYEQSELCCESRRDDLFVDLERFTHFFLLSDRL